MGRYDYQRLEKQPGESELFSIVFPTLGDGVVIASIVSLAFTPVTVPALVLSGQAYLGTVVQVRITGGLDDTVYKGTIKVTTDTGDTVEGDVKLYVKER